MPQEHHHQPSGPLVLAVTLAATAGFVDAHVFLNVAPVFVANMSGNLIHMGMFAGQTEWADVGRAALAIVLFVAGVMVATVHHDRRVREGRSVRPTALLGVEAAIVVALPVLMGSVFASSSVEPWFGDDAVIALAAFAMGLQTAALRRVGSVAVATTYGTGSIVRIGEKLVLAFRRAERVSDGRRTRTIVILVTVVTCYVLGAVLASALGASRWWLLVPGIVLVAAVVFTFEAPEPEWDTVGELDDSSD